VSKKPPIVKTQHLMIGGSFHYRKYFDASLRASSQTGVAIRSPKQLAAQGVMTLGGFIDLCHFSYQ